HPSTYLGSPGPHRRVSRRGGANLEVRSPDAYRAGIRERRSDYSRRRHRSRPIAQRRALQIGHGLCGARMAGARPSNATVPIVRHDMFDDKVLMITGGTGSFGSAVLNRFLDSAVREIRIFSRDEKKQEDMRVAMNSSKLKFYIGDVREYGSVYDAL